MHLAFLTVPADGHVNPTLSLIEELTRRGHRISFAVSDDLGEKVRRAGAEVVTLPRSFPDGPPATVEISMDVLASMINSMVRDAEQSLPVLLRHFEQDRPDAVAYDMMLWTGRVLSDKLGVPRVQLMPSFASNEEYSLSAEFFPELDPNHPALAEALGRFLGFAASLGISASPADLFLPVRDALNLVFMPELFQPAAETFDDRFVFVAPSPGQRELDERWQPPSDRAPVLYVSLGTLFNERPEFFRTVVQAFSGTAWHVAMSVGDRVDIAALGEIPGNFDVRAYFPQPSVLRHATAFITHAGMGSTMEGLYYRVPMITVPQMPEQEANARRIEELAVGRRLAEITPAGLRATVEAVANDEEILANLDRIGDAMASANGPATGADAIEALLARQRATAR